MIELLVAIVIMMVGLLGLMQVVNVALHHNMNTQIRTEATMVADEQLAIELAKPFDLVSTSTGNKVINRPVLTGFRNFSVARTGVEFSNSKQVTISVAWRYKGVRNNHETSSIVSKRTL
jgi:type IV pilus assembly protein PilV